MAGFVMQSQKAQTTSNRNMCCIIFFKKVVNKTGKYY